MSDEHIEKADRLSTKVTRLRQRFFSRCLVNIAAGIWFLSAIALGLSAGELEVETNELVQKLTSATNQEAERILYRICAIGPESTAAQAAALRLMESDDKHVSTAAIIALIWMDEEALPAIWQAMNHENERVKDWMATSLYALGPAGDQLILELAARFARSLETEDGEADLWFRGLRFAPPDLAATVESVVILLEKRLSSNDRRTALDAAQWLHDLRHRAKRAAPALTSAVLTHPSQEVRANAIYALSKCGASGDDLSRCLVLALQDPGGLPERVREHAIEELFKLTPRDPKLTQPILLLMRAHKERYEDGCRILGECGSARAIPYLQWQFRRESAIDDAPARDAYESLMRRAHAAAALARIDPQNREPIEFLRALLDDSLAQFIQTGSQNGLESPCSVAARALGKLPDEASWSLPALRKLMEFRESNSSMSALSAAWAVAQLDPQDADCLKVFDFNWQQDDKLRFRPFDGESPEYVVKVFGDRAAVLGLWKKGITWYSKDDDFITRALVASGPEAIRGYVAGVLDAFDGHEFGLEDRRRTPDFLRSRILDELGPRAAPALDLMIERLRSKQRYIRAAAADRIGRLGPAAKAAVPHLCVTLHDERVVVRLRSAEALGRIGAAATDAVADLEQLKNDPYRSVREAAERAIRAIQPHE